MLLPNSRRKMKKRKKLKRKKERTKQLLKVKNLLVSIQTSDYGLPVSPLPCFLSICSKSPSKSPMNRLLVCELDCTAPSMEWLIKRGFLVWRAESGLAWSGVLPVCIGWSPIAYYLLLFVHVFCFYYECLFAYCCLLSAMQERRKFGSIGFSVPYEFNKYLN